MIHARSDLEAAATEGWNEMCAAAMAAAAAAAAFTAESRASVWLSSGSVSLQEAKAHMETWSGTAVSQ